MFNSPDSDPDEKWQERRGSPRRSLMVRANVYIAGKAPLSAHAVDVSHGGLGLNSPEAMDIGQEVLVAVPLEACGAIRMVRMTGKVCYCSKQGAHYRVGLQFVHLDDETAKFIAAL